jgi:hypothetical protein
VPGTSSLQDIIEVRGAFNGTAESTKATVSGKSTILQRFELAQGERVRDVLDRAGGASVYADLRLALVERSSATGPRSGSRRPRRMLVEKDGTPNIVPGTATCSHLPIVEDKIHLGEVKTRPPGLRPDLTPRIRRAAGALRTAAAGQHAEFRRNSKNLLMAGVAAEPRCSGHGAGSRSSGGKTTSRS